MNMELTYAFFLSRCIEISETIRNNISSEIPKGNSVICILWITYGV